MYKKSLNKFFFVSALLGLITTLFYYNGFGLSDHIEQLPLIYRHFDASYLANDFFVNVAEGDVTRQGYSWLVRNLAGNASNLPYLFFILTALSNMAVSVITYLFAKRLFNNSDVQAIVASAAVMSVYVFGMGWHAELYSVIMVPSSIVLPVLLAAVLAAIEERPLLAAVLCLVSSFLHPLMGLEVFGLIVVYFVIHYLRAKHKPTSQKLLKTVIAIFIFLLCLLYYALPYANTGKLSTHEFINIIAYFRHPHHYVPSHFDLREGYKAIRYILAAVLLYSFSDKKGLNKQYFSASVIFICMLFLLAAGGYVFVEIIPTRIWTIAQTFRLLFIAKWLLVIFISGSMARNAGRLGVLIYYAAMIHPVTMTGAVLVKVLQNKLAGRYLVSILSVTAIFAGVIVLYYVDIYPRYINQYSVFVLCLAAVCGYYNMVVKNIVPMVLVVAFTILIIKDHFYYAYKYHYYASIEWMVFKKRFAIRPRLGFTNMPIIEYASTHTEKDAVFLTPPFWGQFRLLADRAIVVDHKAFPFEDSAMLEWYTRMGDCYGNSRGQLATNELDSNYLMINDTKLSHLSREYNISYAVVPVAMPTELKVLITGGEYKLLSIH